MKNNEIIKVMKDGEEVLANVVECFELDNGKTYILYHFDEDEEMYVSSLTMKPKEIVLDDVSAEEMEVINKMLEEASKEEV